MEGELTERTDLFCSLQYTDLHRNISIWSVASSFCRTVLMAKQPLTKHKTLQRVNVRACGSACSLPTQLQPVSSCVCVCVCVREREISRWVPSGL